MRLLSIATIVSGLLWASPARAQPDFSRLTVKPGDVVYVTEPSGAEVGGPLTNISPSGLTIIGGYAFKPVPGLKIARPGDSLWNGIAIGAAVGAALGATFGRQGCVNSQECPPGALLALSGAMTYGAIGAFIDWLHKGRTVIYDWRAVAQPSVRIAPEVTPSGKALRVTVSF